MEQIVKNTVKAENQVRKAEYVTFERKSGKGIRVLFVGNSITFHGEKPDIGWNRSCGMAASSKEKDYVHLLITCILEKDPEAAFCICQAAEWERHYKEGGDILPLYEQAREFHADIIIMRVIENCCTEAFDVGAFEKEYERLIDFLADRRQAQLILTTGFWHHIGDDVIRRLAVRRGFPLVELGDLGEDEQMKAIGLYEHSGVANHPGDLGMRKIAERILSNIKLL